MTCCPSCGYNITRDEIIVSGDCRIDPRGVIEFEGQVLRLSGTFTTMLHSLAAEHGRTVSQDVLLNRLGSEGLGNVLNVQVCKLRKLLREMGIPSPFRTVRGRGFAWSVAA